MLPERRFHVVPVGTGEGLGDKPVENAGKVITYSGKAIIVKL
jgi:hypothetical protein